MPRTVKIFARGAEQRALASRYPPVERYPGFALFQVPDRDIERLSRRYPVEDITSQYTIRVADRVIALAAAAREVRDRSLPRGDHHCLVQFVGPIKPSWLRRLREAGGEPRVPFQNFTYVVRAGRRALGRIRALSFVRGATHLPYWARLATPLRRRKKLVGARPSLPRTQLVDGAYTVEFFGADDARRALPRVRALGFAIRSAPPGSRLLVVAAGRQEPLRRRQIEKLAAVHGVRSIRERAMKRIANNVAVRFMGTRRALASDGLGLAGAGEVVAICDTGLDTGRARTIHPDFRGRIAGLRSYAIAEEWRDAVANPGADDGAADRAEGHGTHVAGSAVGSGLASRDVGGLDSPIRGLAPSARLFFQAVEQEMRWLDPADGRRFGRFALAGIPADLTDLFAEAYRRGARIHSNSWGGGDPGAYDAPCDQLDRFVWKHRDFCIVCAAGNDAVDRDGNGRIEERSVASPATAKNCVSVGACESERPEFRRETYGAWWARDFPKPPFADDPMADDAGEVAAFSSRGPTLDGRIKPEVVAPGTFILSTRSTCIPEQETAWAAYPRSRWYFHMGGTSMAAPLVAGALALVREYLRRRRKIASPTAALLKAALIAGVHRIGTAADRRRPFDIHQGFGRVDLDAVLAPTPPASVVFHEAERGLQTGQWREWKLDLRSRRPFRAVLCYTDFPGKALVNNLNLVLRSPEGRTYVGNATGRRLIPDIRNNVECIQVSDPPPGRWSIAVVGSNVPQGPQDYALVLVGDLAATAGTIAGGTASRRRRV